MERKPVVLTPRIKRNRVLLKSPMTDIYFQYGPGMGSWVNEKNDHDEITSLTLTLSNYRNSSGTTANC